MCNRWNGKWKRYQLTPDEVAIIAPTYSRSLTCARRPTAPPHIILLQYRIFLSNIISPCSITLIFCLFYQREGVIWYFILITYNDLSKYSWYWYTLRNTLLYFDYFLQWASFHILKRCWPAFIPFDLHISITLPRALHLQCIFSFFNPVTISLYFAR